MSINHHLRLKLCAAALATAGGLTTVQAQVGPASSPIPAPAAAAATRPGWIASAVSLRNGKEGEVPLVTAIVPANADNAVA